MFNPSEFTRIDAIMLLSLLASIAIIIRAIIIRVKTDDNVTLGAGEGLLLAIALPLPGLNLIAAVLFLVTTYKERHVTKSDVQNSALGYNTPIRSTATTGENDVA